MPRFTSRKLAVVLTTLSLVLPATAGAADSVQLVVGFRPSASTPTTHARALHSAGARISDRAVRAGSIQGLRAVVLPVQRSQVAKMRAKLLARGDVAYVELDHTARAYGDVSASWRPNDMFFDQQWALAQLNAERAWEFTRGAGVTVAVLDTGVDYLHPDLKGHVDLGNDYVEDDGDPMDAQGHGTHVSGVVAAAADDNYGIAGLAPNARILAVRVLDEQGQGDYSDVAKGIVHSVAKGAKVINLSLGGPDESELLRSAIDYAAARGVLVTCASGNEGVKQVSYPARYDSCTSVGATDPDDAHASFSNIGAGLDLSAPGVQILSSLPSEGHEAWDGTSMAAPNVAGLGALLYAQGLGRRAVLDTMTSTATDLGVAGLDPVFGHGRIDAGAATEAASRQPRAAADTTAPTVTKVSLLAPRTVTKKVTKDGWKVVSSGKWVRVGTTPEPGSFGWSQTRTKGKSRTVTYFRAKNGTVTRRIVKYKLAAITKATKVKVLRVRIDASDDLGIDRAAVEVDGVTRGVDWSAADGWIVEVPCTAGRHKFVGRVWDAADHEGSGQLMAAPRC